MTNLTQAQNVTDGDMASEGYFNQIYNDSKRTGMTTGSVAVTATLLAMYGADSTRTRAIIRNCSTATLFIGNSATTSANGFPLIPNECKNLNHDESLDAWYVIGPDSISRTATWVTVQ